MKKAWFKRVVAIVIAAIMVLGIVFSVLSSVLISASAAGISSVPATGDNSFIYIAVAAMAVAIVVIIAGIIVAVKRSKKKNDVK